MPLAQGQVLRERYRIAKLIAEGGFGAIYRVWDLTANQPFALKENLDTSAEAQRQFQREAEILKGLSHPNLPRVRDYFVIPNQGQYLIMDFVEGQNLEEMLEQANRPLTEAEIRAWLGQIVNALIYLHTRRPPIIHRDLKLANIIITPANQAILVDFGISKLYDPNLRTTLGARAVTPGFSPVEQYGMGGQTDARTDVYGLAATLYALLTNELPPEAIERLTNGARLKPIKERNLQVSQIFEQAVLRGLALMPDDRFQSMDEFRAALLNDPARQPAPPPVQARPMSAPPADASATRSNFAPGVIIGGIVVVLLCGFIVLGLAMSRAVTPVARESVAVVGQKTATPLPSPPTAAPRQTISAASLATWTAAPPTATPPLPPTQTPTPRPLEPTATPRPATATPIPTEAPPTPVPPTSTPIPAPVYTGPAPAGRFGDIWQSLGGANGRLGIPGASYDNRNYARQRFAGGLMYWWDHPSEADDIWALANDGRWLNFKDTWSDGQPTYPPACPSAAEPYGPRRGFGKVWCDQPPVKAALGEAVESEFGSGDQFEKAKVQFFSQGVMFEIPADNTIIVLFNDGAWASHNR